VNAHLSDEQVTACLAGQGEREAIAHVSSCVQCQAETDALSGAIAGFRGAVDATAPRNLAWEHFSRSATESLRARLPLHWSSPWGIPALAALLLVAAAMLVRTPQPTTINPRQGSLEASREAGDEALLLQIEGALARPAPRALAPAQTIADERATILVGKSTASSKNSNRRINK
jgi:hypothetical protein